MPAALAAALVHFTSIVHRDMFDEDQLRRGTSLGTADWDESIGILAGDFLHTKAFERRCKCAHGGLIGLLPDVARGYPIHI